MAACGPPPTRRAGVVAAGKIGRLAEHPNIHTAVFEYDADDPAGYRAGAVQISRAVGARELAVKLFEIPAGESLCPYHYEYVEEWLLVLEGDVGLRTPAGEERLLAGDLVCFPAGPDGAHKVANGGSAVARILMWSSAREPSVAVYPDSDKLGVWVPGAADNHMFRRAQGHIPYFDGEV